MTTKQDRIAAKITRKQAAEAAGLSMFKVDRVERNADGISDDDRKRYDDAMGKLLAEAAKTQPAAKKQVAKKATSKPGTRARKTTQPKPKPEPEEPAA